MNDEGYKRFLEAQGLHVFEADGAVWAEKRPFFLENVPPHRKVHLNVASIYKLFARGAAVVRYACEESQGEASFEYVCVADDFSLESLSPNARRRVRRGLEACAIRPVELDFLARFGCSINKSTLARQGRAGRHRLTDDGLWQKYMRACTRIPEVEALGAFLGDRLIGYSMVVTVDDYAYLHHTQAYAEELKHSPINALTYTMTKRMLERSGIRFVSQGLESFLPLPEVERFKLSMGFRKRPLGRRVAVNPLTRPFFSPQAVWLARKALGAYRPGLVEDLATFSQSFRKPDKPSRAT